MANITRYDPFSTDLDDVFKGLFVRPVRFDLEGVPQLKIKLDVKAGDSAYTVDAELPGVKKDDIHVNVDGNRVTISAEVKKESEEKKGEELLRSERYYGKLERSFTLDSDLDEAKAQAKYSDGVLKLVLPKKAHASSKRLAVS
ncbi:MAG: Hsp20 family protein [Betaproteobacteria bacterium]|nr:Hsp20 family protein [Betaproteobacteria bacterium]